LYGTGNGTYTIGSPYYRTEVGDFENSASPYGTVDQGGNIWEWNETLISSSRGARGGGWYSDSGTLRAANRYYGDPSIESYGTGFRVASIPEPGSITLLACAAVAGFVWWRRRRKR